MATPSGLAIFRKAEKHLFLPLFSTQKTQFSFQSTFRAILAYASILDLSIKNASISSKEFDKDITVLVFAKL